MGWHDRPVTAATARRGYVLVLAGAVLFGLNGGISRIAMRGGIDPLPFTSARITGAAIVLALLAALWRPAVLRPPRGRSLLLIAGLGLVGVAALQLTYNVAINRLPLGVALLLEYLAPVLVVLWVRVVRREDVHRRMWGAVACAVGGLALVAQVWGDLRLDGLGVTMGLLAAVSFATYFLLGEHNVGTQDPLHVILWSFVMAAVLMNLVSPSWRLGDLTRDVSALERLDHLSVPLWLPLVWVIVLGTVTPFFLQLVALQHLPATQVTMVATLEPVLAVLLGWAWFAESLSGVQLVGVGVVMAGIVLAQSARRSAPADLPTPQ